MSASCITALQQATKDISRSKIVHRIMTLSPYFSHESDCSGFIKARRKWYISMHIEVFRNQLIYSLNAFINTFLSDKSVTLLSTQIHLPLVFGVCHEWNVLCQVRFVMPAYSWISLTLEADVNSGLLYLLLGQILELRCWWRFVLCGSLLLCLLWCLNRERGHSDYRVNIQYYCHNFSFITSVGNCK